LISTISRSNCTEPFFPPIFAVVAPPIRTTHIHDKPYGRHKQQQPRSGDRNKGQEEQAQPQDPGMTHHGKDIGSGPDQAIAYPIGGVGLNAPDISTNYRPRTRPCQEHLSYSRYRSKQRVALPRGTPKAPNWRVSAYCRSSCLAPYSSTLPTATGATTPR
jgi:hypothetical protein